MFIPCINCNWFARRFFETNLRSIYDLQIITIAQTWDVFTRIYENYSFNIAAHSQKVDAFGCINFFTFIQYLNYKWFSTSFFGINLIRKHDLKIIKINQTWEVSMKIVNSISQHEQKKLMRLDFCINFFTFRQYLNYNSLWRRFLKPTREANDSLVFFSVAIKMKPSN